MGLISNKTKYPNKTPIVSTDYFPVTDGVTGDTKHVTFPDVVTFVNSSSEEPTTASFSEYRFSTTIDFATTTGIFNSISDELILDNITGLQFNILNTESVDITSILTLIGNNVDKFNLTLREAGNTSFLASFNITSITPIIDGATTTGYLVSLVHDITAGTQPLTDGATYSLGFSNKTDSLEIVSVTSSRNYQASDNGKLLVFRNTGVTMTVPATGLPDNWNVAGKALTGFDITNAEGSGVTIDRRDSTASGLQFSEHEPFTIVREGNTQTYIQTP